MKKILFSAVNLEMGGVEKALVMLINNLANRLDDNGKNKYKVTLDLEEKKGDIFKPTWFKSRSFRI